MLDPPPPVEPGPLPTGDHERFTRWVVPEIEVLLRVARTVTSNHAEAEDLVQDTLVRALRSIQTFDGAHPRAWLLTILRNTHINRNRRRRPELLRDPEHSQAPLANVVASELTDDVVEFGFAAELEIALADLDEPFRQAVEAVDIHGMSYAEAAQHLGVATGTIMSRLHRARHRMRDQLERAGFAPRMQ